MSTPFDLGYQNPVATVQINTGFVGAAQAQAAAMSTAADRAATAADRVQTGLDRTQTDADAAATAADRVQTGLDRLQTGADRVQTGNDAATTIANAASTHADATATAADRVQTGLDRTQTGADRVQTDADAAATAADRVQTGLDRQQTGADRVQTGLDRAQTDADVITTGTNAASVVSAQNASAVSALTATAQAALAAVYASSVASVAQQDLSGTTATSLHRSPNAIVGMCVYDTSRDSDGGAWVDKATWQSWANESLNGAWIYSPLAGFMGIGAGSTSGSQNSTSPDLVSRAMGGTLGANLLSGSWSSFSSGTVSGTATDFTVTSVGYAGAQLAVTVEANALYLVTGRVTGANAGRIYTNATASLTSPWTNVASLNGGFAFVVTPSGTTMTLMAGCGTSGQTVSFAGLQVQKVVAQAPSGSYFQSASDGKFYRLWQNLMPMSEGNVASLASSTGVTDAATSITGFDNSIQFPATAATVSAYRGNSTAVGAQVTLSMYVQMDDNSAPRVTATTTDPNTDFSLTINNAPLGADTITSVGNNVYRVSVAVPSSIGYSNAGPVRYAGQSAKGFRVTGMQLNYGPLAAYEKRTTTGVGKDEVFRGNTSKFPRVAGIVAEASNITIYDLMTPGRPMWMRFAALTTTTKSEYLPTTATVTGVSMVNGRMWYCGSAGNVYLSTADFILDRGWRYNTSGYGWRFDVIAHRQVTPTASWLDLSPVGIPSLTCYAVAATVMPDAPFDAATGLPVSTVVVGTSGGVSLFKHDGTVVNSGNTAAFTKVAITPYMLTATNGSGYSYLAVNPSSLAAGWSFTSSTAANNPGSPSTGSGLGSVALYGRSNAAFVAAGVGNPGRLSLLLANSGSFGSALTAQIDAYSNTGWMVGDIRRCYLSSNQIGATSAGYNIITDGTFDNASTVNLYGLQDANMSRTVSGGVLTTTTNTSAGSDFVYYSATTEPGVQYTINVTCAVVATAYGGWLDVRDGTNSGYGAPPLNTGSGNYSTSTAATGTITTTFVAVSATTAIRLRMYKMQNDASMTWDNFTCSVVALGDRSYKLQPITLNGALTKTLSGGLSMYSGWSATNYLQQAYSADLDFGTSAWRISSWLNIPAGSHGPSNLFVNSGDYTQSQWVKQAGTITGSITAPDSSTSAFLFKEDTTTTTHQLYQSVSINPAQTVTYTVYAKAAGRTQIEFGGNWMFTTVLVDLTAGTVSGATASKVTATSAGNGWWKLVMTDVPPDTSARSYVVRLYNGSSDNYAGDGASGVYLWHPQLEIGSTSSAYNASGAAAYNGIAPIIDRSAATGAYIRAGVDGNGNLAVEVYDGTTTRRATSSLTYNNTTNIKASFEYSTSGTLTVGVNGVSAGTATGNPLLTLSNASAVTTIGNARTLDAAFPGSIALVKAGATLPTQDQRAFMFQQEQAMFQSGNACTLPDPTTLLEMDYDAPADKVKVVSASNESTFQGLVRTSTAAVSAGAFSKVAHKSNVKLLARNTTNPGVDVTIPAQALMAELANRDRAAAEKARLEEVFDWVGGFTANTSSTASQNALQSVSPQTNTWAGSLYPTTATVFGAQITGTGIPAGTTLLSFEGTTVVRMSANATATGTGVAIAFTDFILPVGYEAKSVMVNGTFKQEGSTKDWTRLYDGFRETIRFAVAPGSTAWVQIKARRTK